MARKQHSDHGMTLVEIMITMIISSIIAASTFMFFAGQQRIYETQTKVLNIQQNLWAALEVLARYTRASGGGLFECVRPASYADTNVNDGSRDRSTSPSPGPLTPNLTTPPQTGIRAYHPTNGMQRIPPLWIVDNSTSDAGVVANTDIITVAFGNRTSGMDVDAMLALSVADTVTPISLAGDNTANIFRQGEFILLLNLPNYGHGTDPTTDRGCTMFQISNWTANTTTLQHSSVAGDIVWNPPDNQLTMLPGGGYIVGQAGVRNLGSLNWVRFFIRSDSNGVPNLMMQQLHLGGVPGTPQVLAEGIEDLQISFACDTGGLWTHSLAALNGQIDEGFDDASKKNDEWWNNVPDDNLPAINTDGYCNLPTAIRLTLVSRTRNPDDLVDSTATGNGPMDIENHRYASPRPADQFRRRVLSTTVYPRNNKSM